MPARGVLWAPSLLLAAVSGICQAMVITAPPYGHQLGFAAAASASFDLGFLHRRRPDQNLGRRSWRTFWDSARFAVPHFPRFVHRRCPWRSLWIFTSYGAVLLTACALAGISLGGTIPTCSAFLNASLVRRAPGSAR